MGLPVPENLVVRPRVVHVTTAHRADDVRIFERECRSLAATDLYDIYLAAAGRIPGDSGVTLVPLVPAPTNRLGRFSSGPLKAWALSRAVSAELWHFHDPELLPVALTLARSGRRVIWDAHEDYVSQFTEDGGKSWVPAPVRGVVRRGMKAMLEAVDRDAAAVIAATPTIAARYNNPRTVVVGNEARLEDFNGCRPDFSARRLLFVGHAGSAHLFGELVEAVTALPDVKLAVAGDQLTPDVLGRSKDLLGDRLECLGWLNRAGLATAVDSSSLGLALYAPLPTYMSSDASPTKVSEFAAAGLPILGSPIPVVEKALREGRSGFLAGGFTSTDLRKAIDGALRDPVVWHEASENARLWAGTTGDWGRSETELMRIYSEILGA